MTDAQVSRQKPGSTARGQQRTFAFENLLEQIEPSNFTIEVLDPDFNPIADMRFIVKLGSQSLERKTDNNGILKMPRKEEITLSIAG